MKRRLRAARREMKKSTAAERERAETEILVGWLNEKRSSAEYGRVVQLVRLFRQARAENPPLTIRELVERETSPEHAKIDPWSKIRKINAQLQKFDISPRIIVRKTSVYLGVGKKTGRESGTRFGWQWWHPNDLAARAAYTVFRLEERGVFDSLRECVNCKKWLLARRQTQRFCSPKCRDQVYRTSETGRKTRTMYMRRYRKGLRAYQDRGAKGHKLRPGPRTYLKA